MAYPNYQTPTKITFYPSYLQYLYATGQLGVASVVQGLEQYGVEYPEFPQENLVSLLILDPSNTTKFEGGNTSRITYHLPAADLADYFDFGMILGHNLAQNKAFHPYGFGLDNEPATAIGTTPVVNWDSSVNAPPPYHGFSVFNMTYGVGHFPKIGFYQNYASTVEPTIEIGALSMGRKWEAPQNVDISSSMKFNTKSKQKKTKSGKTLSNLEYYKPNRWVGGLDAWMLSEMMDLEPIGEADTTLNPVLKDGRVGVREWKVKWSMLAESKSIPQNLMSNSVGWIGDEDDEYEKDHLGRSRYSSRYGVDFITSVLRVTMGSHLPCVVRISESNNPDQWAIVRIKKHKIKQRNPKLIDISVTLEEQV